MRALVCMLALACGPHDAADTDTDTDTAADTDTVTPITIEGHCPDHEPGTDPPVVTITGHDDCVLVWLTNDQDTWASELEVCGGYGEWLSYDGITPGTTPLSCEMFADWGNGGTRIAVSMVVGGECHGFGDGAEWCP